MDIRGQFGRLLRDMRISKGLTQEELAFRAGMNVTYLSDIERGRSSPSLTLLADLAMALGTHPADLLREIRLEGESPAGGRKRPKDR
ncbi:MAG: helix-turn-helix transcriptional regulator [Magnetospirillum sp.]|nr:helix-turn-helix transcriptional regulator [Magnetospirillum sp.]